jgi:hypothetical protein
MSTHKFPEFSIRGDTRRVDCDPVKSVFFFPWNYKGHWLLT